MFIDIHTCYDGRKAVPILFISFRHYVFHIPVSRYDDFELVRTERFGQCTIRRREGQRKNKQSLSSVQLVCKFSATRKFDYLEDYFYYKSYLCDVNPSQRGSKKYVTRNCEKLSMK